MNKYLYTKLGNVLRAEATYVSENVENLDEKFSQLSTIMNLLKFIEHYDELEPWLKEFFDQKVAEKKIDKEI